MPTKSVKTLQLVEGNIEEQVVALAIQGLQPKQIGDQLGLTRATVSKHMSAALARTSEELIYKADVLVTTNFLRMEALMEAVAPWALGHTFINHEGEEQELPPDRHYGKLYLDVIKAENELHRRLVEAKSKNRDGDQFNIEHMELTLVAGGEMYTEAQETMSEDYLTEYLDMDADDLIVGQLVAPDPDELEEKLTQLDSAMKTLIPEGEEDEDDTR